MQTRTLTSNNQRVRIGTYGHGTSCLLHVRSTATGGGTIAVQYAVVDEPAEATDAHWETLEGLSGLTPGSTRPIYWPGTLAVRLTGASGTISVPVDVQVGV